MNSRLIMRSKKRTNLAAALRPARHAALAHAAHHAHPAVEELRGQQPYGHVGGRGADDGDGSVRHEQPRRQPDPPDPAGAHAGTPMNL